MEFQLTITDSPSPTDPFLITFSATAVPGTPSLYNWSFGDGSPPWSGSAPSYAQPAHRYSGPGSYNASLTAWEGTASVTRWILVDLTAVPLRATIGESAVSGAVPFTVTFTGTVAGGSGSYRSMTWNFGDGRGSGSGLVVAYTYAQAGAYEIRFNVTDSQGRSAQAVAWINATATTGGGPSFWSSLAAASPVIVALGLGFAAAVALGLWLGLHRRPAGPLGPGNDFEESVEEPAPSVSAPAPVEPVTMPGRPDPAQPSLPSSAAPSAAPPAPAPRAGPTKVRVAPEALRVSQRIVLHLAGLGTLGADEVATLGFTQIGMSESLGVRQNALTNVLRRLVAAGIVSEDVRHVSGQPRRLKVYRLTSRGEALAKDLRRHRAATRPRDSPGGPGAPGT